MSRRRQQFASHKSQAVRELAAKVFVDKIDADRAKIIAQYAGRTRQAERRCCPR